MCGLLWVGMLLIGAVASTPLAKDLWARGADRPWMKTVEAVLVAAGLVLSVAGLVSDSYNPFLYFRF